MLLDTSGLMCLLNRSERFHTEALSAYRAGNRRMSHSYVVAEFVALAQARAMRRKKALAFAERITTDPTIEFVWVDNALHQQAMELLLSRLDKTYSLCDAVSFVLMRQRGINEALTNDRHFEQEGFVRLLK